MAIIIITLILMIAGVVLYEKYSDPEGRDKGKRISGEGGGSGDGDSGCGGGDGG